MKLTARRGIQRSFGPALLAAVVALPLGYAFLPGGGAGTGGGEAEGVTLALTQTQAVALLRTSLGPEALVAGGLTPAQAKDVIDAGKEAFGAKAQELAAADSAFAAARTSVDTLSRKVRSGLASSQEVSDLASAKAALADATAARTAALDAIWNGAVAGAGDTAKTRLANVRANASWKLPAAYLTVEREEAEWVKLRNVLDQKKVCIADGVELDGACAAHLADVESDTAVAAALSGVATHFTTLDAAWKAALAPSGG